MKTSQMMASFFRMIAWPAMVLFTRSAPADPSVPPPLRILAVGDSITQGGKTNREEYTYRLPLQKLLLNEKIAFDFIGSRQQGLQAKAVWPDPVAGTAFDPDHEGYYGNTTRQVVDKVRAAWTDQSPAPDIVLIHLGTNDQKNEDTDTAVIAPLREFIAFLRQKNPRVVVLLGHLNFNAGPAKTHIRPLVEALAEELNTEASPVKTVHHYVGWNEHPEHAQTDTFDWAHPNPRGQQKMAEKWWEAMRPFLKR